METNPGSWNPEDGLRPTKWHSFLLVEDRDETNKEY